MIETTLELDETASRLLRETLYTLTGPEQLTLVKMCSKLLNFLEISYPYIYPWGEIFVILMKVFYKESGFKTKLIFKNTVKSASSRKLNRMPILPNSEIRDVV